MPEGKVWPSTAVVIVNGNVVESVEVVDVPDVDG
jgi:hypothetical protein